MTDQDPTQPYQPAVEPTAPAAPPAATGQPAPLAPPPPPALGAADSPTVPIEVPPAPVPEAPPAAPAPPAPVYPDATAPASADTAAAAAAVKRKGSPVRWIVALLVVALLVAGGVGAALMLTSSSPAPSVLSYAPADSVLYAEARLDLPGSQQAELAKTLSGFPGFADQAALKTKLGEVLDRIVGAASNGKHTYQTEIAPWFGGQIGVAQGPITLPSLPDLGLSASPAPAASAAASLPPCTGAASSAAPAASGGDLAAIAASVRAEILAGVTDAKKAEAWAGSLVSEMGATTSDQTCDGTVVHLVTAPAGSAVQSTDFGWAIISGRVLVIGDLQSIRASIATKGTAGLAADATLQKATAALPGDRLAFFYENIKATLGGSLSSLGSSAGAEASAVIGLLQGFVPEWTAGSLKASGGNFVAEIVQPAVSDLPSANRPSDLASYVPASTIYLNDIHDVGKTLTLLHDRAAADPALKSYVEQLDSALGLAGGFAGTIGWIGDVGLAITRDSSGVSGGILIRPDDAAAAKRLFDQLRSLLQLAGAGSGISLKEETYKGATITTLDLSALAPLIQQGLAGSGVGSAVTVPADLKLVYAVTDKVVVFTISDAFAKAVVDAAAGGDSLAKNARFGTLLKANGGEQNTGLTWVDITALRELVEGILPADARAQYDADVRPYLIPLDVLLTTGKLETGLQRGTITLSIKH